MIKETLKIFLQNIISNKIQPKKIMWELQHMSTKNSKKWDSPSGQI